MATEEDKNSYVEALIVTDKLLAVDKTGRVTIYSTASKIYTDVIKPIIEKKLRLKALLESRKKEIKEEMKQKKVKPEGKEDLKKVMKAARKI